MAIQQTLTTRESETLRLSAWGHGNKQIAARFGVSVKTVEAHKANAMRKLGITDRVGLVRHAVRAGWLTVDNDDAASHQ
jgi:DNA-binding NarL/FixJ family response regulator